MITDKQNVDFTKSKYTVTLYTKTFQISTGKHIYNITNEYTIKNEHMYIQDDEFYLNVHDRTFIKGTVKIKTIFDTLYRIQHLPDVENVQPYDDGSYDDCTECSESLEKCQEEYAEKEKGYEDKLKNCHQQIDVCDKLNNKRINQLLTNIEEKDTECTRRLEEKDIECKNLEPKDTCKSSLEQKDYECNSSLEEKDYECKRSLEKKHIEYIENLEEKENDCKRRLEEEDIKCKDKIIKNQRINENDHERIYQTLRDELYDLTKLKKLSDERENDCINENIELKRENEELKKQIKSNNQNSKCSQTTPKTSIIICVIIIVLLLGLCIYLYFFKR